MPRNPNNIVVLTDLQARLVHETLAGDLSDHHHLMEPSLRRKMQNVIDDVREQLGPRFISEFDNTKTKDGPRFKYTLVDSEKVER